MTEHVLAILRDPRQTLLVEWPGESRESLATAGHTVREDAGLAGGPFVEMERGRMQELARKGVHFGQVKPIGEAAPPNKRAVPRHVYESELAPQGWEACDNPDSVLRVRIASPEISEREVTCKEFKEKWQALGAEVIGGDNCQPPERIEVQGPAGRMVVTKPDYQRHFRRQGYRPVAEAAVAAEEPSRRELPADPEE